MRNDRGSVEDLYSLPSPGGAQAVGTARGLGAGGWANSSWASAVYNNMKHASLSFQGSVWWSACVPQVLLLLRHQSGRQSTMPASAGSSTLGTLISFLVVAECFSL